MQAATSTPFSGCNHGSESALDDHLRSINRAAVYVQGDGNCQFRAITQQLQECGLSNDDHTLVRLNAVQWLLKNPKYSLQVFVCQF
jgi:hypothetical protein